MFADGCFVLWVCSLCGLVMIYVLFVGYWIWFWMDLWVVLRPNARIFVVVLVLDCDWFRCLLGDC